jgi:hypothetical protein
MDSSVAGLRDDGFGIMRLEGSSEPVRGQSRLVRCLFTCSNAARAAEVPQANSGRFRCDLRHLDRLASQSLNRFRLGHPAADGWQTSQDQVNVTDNHIADLRKGLLNTT